MPEPQNTAQVTASEDAYAVYFDSGFYDRRYPAPNRTMWRRIEAMLSPKGAVLDFGCGTGRYLMCLRGKARRVIGYDISSAALASIRQKAVQSGWDDLVVLGPEPEAVDAHVAEHGQVDLVICLFGVLGHITDGGVRADALLRMRRALVPGRGRLLVSVPNRTRRFRAEQRAAQGSLVSYQRSTEDGRPVALSYQLFDPGMLVAELAAAGFSLRRIGCESVLPESWLLHHAALRVIDGWLTPLCPVRWGYGIFAEASC